MTVNCSKCDKPGQGDIDNLPEGWKAKVSTLTDRAFPICDSCQIIDEKPKSQGTGDHAAEQLRLLIERVERLEEEKKGISDDIRDVYSEAKATGWDVKTMRSIIRLRKMEKGDRLEADALLETYREALGL